MRSTGTDGLSRARRESEAANEEFTGIPSGREKARTDPAGGWNPYEVWRTRVKAPDPAGEEPARDPWG